ncbi:hypothetical protein D3C84_872880 [compost metagenome]
MLRFRFPKRAGRGDFGDHLAGPKAGSFDVGHGVFGNLSLLIAEVEQRRSVARADIVALAILGGGVMNLEKELENLAIADLLRIEHDLDGFRVIAVVAISRVRHIASRVTHPCGQHAGVTSQQILHTPEATTGQDGGFGLRRHERSFSSMKVARY